MRRVIILGAGSSIKSGLSLGLWEKIQNEEVWSINYAFKTMPFLPKRELWIDTRFFHGNMQELYNLFRKGVSCYAKTHQKYVNIPEIRTYECTRSPQEFDKKIFIGRMGISGIFALYLATMIEKVDEVYLLGYDWGSITNDKQTHYYQNTLVTDSVGVGRPELYKNPDGTVKGEVDDFSLFLRPDIKTKIYNVSPNSAINYFDKLTYEEFFKKLI